jgi:hypothetical protein
MIRHRGRRPWYADVSARLAHWAPLLCVLLVPALLLVDIVAEDDLDARVAWSSPLLVAGIVVLVAQARHQWRLCVLCGAATPQDGQRSAERARPLLWVRHHFWFLTAVSVVLVSAVRFARIMGWMGYVPAVMAGRSMILVLALMAQGLLTHRVHEPWCVYCGGRWGDGGEEETAPDPGPLTTGARS